MLSKERLMELFCATNTAEPLAEGWPGLERFARAIEAAVCPPGYVVVPAEPTEYMVERGVWEITDKGDLEPTSSEIALAYEVMIAARPEVKP